MREPASAIAGLIEDPPLPPSLLKMIATIGPVGALERWTPAPIHPAIMPAPIYSQFDGSIWAGSNRGPGLALDGAGAHPESARIRLRSAASLTTRWVPPIPSRGSSLEALAAAAQGSGAGTKGLVGANGYRTWAIDDLKRELGLDIRSVLLHYRLIPGTTADSSFYGDHYVVALGFDQQGNLVYNDPRQRRPRRPPPPELQLSSTMPGRIPGPARFAPRWRFTGESGARQVPGSA